MLSPAPLRLVVIAPENLVPGGSDETEQLLAERSRQLRIGLLENGYNVVAVLPTDTFLRERIAQLQPDMIIVDAGCTRRVFATADGRARFADAIYQPVAEPREPRYPVLADHRPAARPVARDEPHRQLCRWG